MATYAATVVLDTPRPARLGNTPMGVLSGSCHVTNYNQTPVAISAITKAFLPGGKLTVVPNGISSGGFIMAWDAATTAFRAYGAVGTGITVGSGTITASAPTITTGTNATTTAPVYVNSGALTETTGATGITGVQAPIITDTRGLSTATGAIAQAASDQDLGTFTFLAIGQLG